MTTSSQAYLRFLQAARHEQRTRALSQEISHHSSSLVDKLDNTALGILILPMHLQVISQTLDALSQYSHWKQRRKQADEHITFTTSRARTSRESWSILYRCLNILQIERT